MQENMINNCTLEEAIRYADQSNPEVKAICHGVKKLQDDVVDVFGDSESELEMLNAKIQDLETEVKHILEVYNSNEGVKELGITVDELFNTVAKYQELYNQVLSKVTEVVSF